MKQWILVLLSAVLCLLTACAQQSATTETVDIVVVPQVWSEEVRVEIAAHVAERPELNVYQNMAHESDALYQALLVEDLTAQEVAAICIDPIDETVQPMLEKAQEAGIVVITGTDFCAMIDQAALELGK